VRKGACALGTYAHLLFSRADGRVTNERRNVRAVSKRNPARNTMNVHRARDITRCRSIRPYSITIKRETGGDREASICEISLSRCSQCPCDVQDEDFVARLGRFEGRADRHFRRRAKRAPPGPRKFTVPTRKGAPRARI